MVTWNDLTEQKTGFEIGGTCRQVSQENIMPKSRGSAGMYERGLKSVQVFVPEERKDKLKQYCSEKGISQQELINGFLAKELSDFNPSGHDQF